jgi:PAS domain S-box-containing protein
MPRTAPSSVLDRLVAQGTRPGDLLPELHRELLASTGGSRSIVLERHGNEYRATSGRGFGELGARIAGNEAFELTSRVTEYPAIIELGALPTLQRVLASARALIVPVVGWREPGVLAVGDPSAPDDQVLASASTASVEFGLVVEWNHLARERSFHERLREFSVAFWRSLASPASGQIALESLTSDVNTLLGTKAVSIWLHDRRARELVLSASSDPVRQAARPRVSADDRRHPVADGLRLDRAQAIDTAGADPVIVAPLRGWRRALGVVTIDGSAPGFDDAGRLALVQELTRQLSVAIENRQLLDEILKQRRLLEDTFHSLDDLLVVTNSGLRVVQTNEAFASRLHSTRAALIDRRLDELVGPELTAWIQGDETAVDTMATARTRTFDSSVLGGTFIVTVTPLVSQDGESAGRVMVARDITAQMRLEAEREVLRTKLAQTEKLAALGQFVAGIAHEMNNPLQGVLGHLELLIDNNPSAKSVRAELRRIYHDADRAAKIVHDLLVFTGSHRMTRRRLKIDRVLSRALASRRTAQARQQITVLRDHAGSLPAVVGDPVLLQQAFVNVMVNAEQAIAGAGPAGTIRITTCLSDDRERIVTTISDSGRGIAPDHLPRVFDPFFTTKEVGQGTGLGLAITYGIVQEHRGVITVANAPDGGAAVTLELPVADSVEGV